jgi:hypothetical protein
MNRPDYDRAVTNAKRLLAGHDVTAADLTKICEALVAVAALPENGMAFMTYSERRAHTASMRKSMRDLCARLADEVVDG